MKWEIPFQYNLDCNESRNFSYIEKIQTWRGQKCCDWPDTPNYVFPFNFCRSIREIDVLKCGLCVIYCRATATCKKRK
jgi:hypothetical protein